jgi:hypothetical protein
MLGFTWQYFINYNMAKGGYLTSVPIITANWEADSDNRWTVMFLYVSPVMREMPVLSGFKTHNIISLD